MGISFYKPRINVVVVTCLCNTTLTAAIDVAYLGSSMLSVYIANLSAAYGDVGIAVNSTFLTTTIDTLSYCTAGQIYRSIVNLRYQTKTGTKHVACNGCTQNIGGFISDRCSHIGTYCNGGLCTDVHMGVTLNICFTTATIDITDGSYFVFNLTTDGVSINIGLI